jgi:hypothetical protein
MTYYCNACGETSTWRRVVHLSACPLLEAEMQWRTAWFKPEHRRGDVLTACAQAGMTAEQALDERARREAELLAQCLKLATTQTPIIVLPSEDT